VRGHRRGAGVPHHGTVSDHQPPRMFLVRRERRATADSVWSCDASGLDREVQSPPSAACPLVVRSPSEKSSTSRSGRHSRPAPAVRRWARALEVVALDGAPVAWLSSASFRHVPMNAVSSGLCESRGSCWRGSRLGGGWLLRPRSSHGRSAARSLPDRVGYRQASSQGSSSVRIRFRMFGPRLPKLVRRLSSGWACFHSPAPIRIAPTLQWPHGLRHRGPMFTARTCMMRRTRPCRRYSRPIVRRAAEQYRASWPGRGEKEETVLKILHLWRSGGV
jgi:hypothetical protein